jgi:hypothetical protein
MQAIPAAREFETKDGSRWTGCFPMALLLVSLPSEEERLVAAMINAGPAVPAIGGE